MPAPTPAAPTPRPVRRRPHDTAVLVLPAPPGHPSGEVVRRWWYIEQPRVSVAFALQARVATALGGSAGFFIDALLVDSDQIEDYEAEKRTAGEALALQTLARARSGQNLWDPESAVPCSARLWAVIHAAAKRSADGARLDALLLAGEPERERGGAPDAYRWAKPSLLHQVLLACGLRFDGEGAEPKAPILDAMPPANAPDEVRRRMALRDAVALGGVGEFLRALDDILVSPDELALLSAWAVLHLWRPF